MRQVGTDRVALRWRSCVRLEQLTPLERAVFLLRDVFDYDDREIAAILDREQAARRQSLRNARGSILPLAGHASAVAGRRSQLLSRLYQAVGVGDIDGLVQLLAGDVSLWADSGGKVRRKRRANPWPVLLPSHAFWRRLPVARVKQMRSTLVMSTYVRSTVNLPLSYGWTARRDWSSLSTSTTDALQLSGRSGSFDKPHRVNQP